MKILLISAIATLIPSPFDFIHFYLQNYLYTSKPSRAMFEILQIIDWYFIDTLYYVLLMGLVLILDIQQVSTTKIVTIIFTIIGTGAVISIITRFSTLFSRMIE